MIHALDPLREFSFLSALLRLLLAVLCGTVIGYGRSSMQRTAGMRTYVLTALGACMAVLISQIRVMLGVISASDIEV